MRPKRNEMRPAVSESLAMGGAGVFVTWLIAVGLLDGGAGLACGVVTVVTYGVLVASALARRGQPPSWRDGMILRWFVPIVFLLLAGVVAPWLTGR